MNQDMFQKGKAQTTVNDLGKIITSWIYKPPKSNKFLYYVLGVLGALVIFTIYWGEDLLPWIKKIPSMLIYVAIFLFTPLVKLLKGMGKDEEWTLYENGFVAIKKQNNAAVSQRIGHWRDFTRCSYDKKGVKLQTDMPFQPALRVPVSMNTMEIYSICRERISLAAAHKLDKAVKPPERPKTQEQQRLRRAENKYSEHRPKSGFWGG
ncbi:hypothetical protein JW935_22830 [candidate division KSB1 bacterium]|nr:hypothetical protein [candidate division KSB1 bacterium]